MKTTPAPRGRILWADDEIDLLKAHVRFLTGKGFTVDTATNGDDAITLCREQRYDVVLLDEMMQGKDGLETLAHLKAEHPALAVIMITKNEEESLMEEAIGSKISDYLTKPVNPSQILLAVMKILENRQIRQDSISGKYMEAFTGLSRRIEGAGSADEWMSIHHQLSEWTLQLDDFPELGFGEMLLQQEHEANILFSRYIMDHYERWLRAPMENRPTLSPDVLKKYVQPHLRQDRKVLFLLVDCMRWDQWLTLEAITYPLFQLKRDGFLAILPTTTEYSRNAIFSGLFPDDMARMHADWWSGTDERSLNRHEADFLAEHMLRLGMDLKPPLKYRKILNRREGELFTRRFASFTAHPLVAVVVNHVDLLAHRRTDSEILQEILPNEASYRQIVRAWFENSWILDLLQQAAEQEYTVVITSDHGSVRVQQPTQILADREASVNLRYKQGRNLNPSTKDAWFLPSPNRLRIPAKGVNDTLALALQTYYFLYPTNYRKYQNKFANTYQHGGLSMWEMIMPVATLSPRG